MINERNPINVAGDSTKKTLTNLWTFAYISIRIAEDGRCARKISKLIAAINERKQITNKIEKLFVLEQKAMNITTHCMPACSRSSGTKKFDYGSAN